MRVRKEVREGLREKGKGIEGEDREWKGRGEGKGGMGGIREGGRMGMEKGEERKGIRQKRHLYVCYNWQIWVGSSPSQLNTDCKFTEKKLFTVRGLG